jgi:hypothetical protein
VEETWVMSILFQIKSFVSNLWQNSPQCCDYSEIRPPTKLMKIPYPAADCKTIISANNVSTTPFS